jgi:hypothetical protein
MPKNKTMYNERPLTNFETGKLLKVRNFLKVLVNVRSQRHFCARAYRIPCLQAAVLEIPVLHTIRYRIAYLEAVPTSDANTE